MYPNANQKFDGNLSASLSFQILSANIAELVFMID